MMQQPLEEARALEAIMKAFREEDFREQEADLQRLGKAFDKVIQRPELLLKSAELNQLFTESVNQLQGSDVEWKVSFKSPGFYFLLLHCDKRVRAWASGMVEDKLGLVSPEEWPIVLPTLQRAMEVLEFGMLDMVEEGTSQVFANVFTHEREPFWEGLHKLLQRLDAGTIRECFVKAFPGFFEIAFNHLSYTFIYCLKCMQVLADALGYFVWIEHAVTATSVRDITLSHCVGAAADDTTFFACLEFLHPFLRSLVAFETAFVLEVDHIINVFNEKVLNSSQFSERAKHVAIKHIFQFILLSFSSTPPQLPLSSLPIWGPLLVTSVCCSTEESLSEVAVQLLRKIILSDITNLRQYFFDHLVQLEQSQDDNGKVDPQLRKELARKLDVNPMRGFVWCAEVWNTLLPVGHDDQQDSSGGGATEYPNNLSSNNSINNEEIAQRILHMPFPLHVQLLCTFNDVALLDSKHLTCLHDVEQEDPLSMHESDRRCGETLVRYRERMANYLSYLRLSSDLVRELLNCTNVVYALFSFLVSPERKVRFQMEALLKSRGGGLIMDTLKTLVSTYSLPLVEGIRDVLRDVIMVGVSACYDSWQHLFLFIDKLLPIIQEHASGKDKEEKLAINNAMEEIYRLLAETTEDIIANSQFFVEEPTYELTLSEFLEFFQKHGSKLLVHTMPSIKDTSEEEEEEAPERTIAMLERHSSWFPSFFELATNRNHVINARWFACLIAILIELRRHEMELHETYRAACIHMLQDGSLNDTQALQLAEFFPGAVGTLGLKWNMRELPSSSDSQQRISPLTISSLSSSSSSPSSSFSSLASPGFSVTSAPAPSTIEAPSSLLVTVPKEVTPFKQTLSSPKQKDSKQQTIPSMFQAVQRNPYASFPSSGSSSSQSSLSSSSSSSSSSFSSSLASLASTPSTSSLAPPSLGASKKKTPTSTKTTDSKTDIGWNYGWGVKYEQLNAGNTSSPSSSTPKLSSSSSSTSSTVIDSNFHFDQFAKWQKKKPKSTSLSSTSSSSSSSSSKAAASLKTTAARPALPKSSLKNKELRLLRGNARSIAAARRGQGHVQTQGGSSRWAMTRSMLQNRQTSSSKWHPDSYLDETEELQQVHGRQLLKEVTAEHIHNREREKTQMIGSHATSYSRQAKVIELSNVTASSVLQQRRYMEEQQLAKQMMAPPLTLLHDKVLCWDYFHLEQEERPITAKVPIHFESVAQYKSTFLPLLLEEFRASLQQEKTENAHPEVRQMRVVQLSRVDNYHMVHVQRPLDSTVNLNEFLENDVMLICNTSYAPDKSGLHILGIVEKKEVYRKEALEILHIKLSASHPRGRMIHSWLRENSVYPLQKVGRISTTNREYQALQAMQYFTLSPVILNPLATRPTQSNYDGSPSRVLPSRLKAVFEQAFNPSQLVAIEQSLAALDEFVLLQGPPGTGKTRTIQGLISALLATNTEEMDKNQKAILVCAPSNAAVDEICLRLCASGVWNAQGQLVRPNMVRFGVGSSANPALQDISIENLLEQRFQTKIVDAEFRAARESIFQEINSKNTEISTVMAEKELIKEELRQAQLSSIPTTEREAILRAKEADVNMRLRELFKQKDDLYQRKKKVEADTHQAALHRKEGEKEILDHADVVLTTLSGSGTDCFANLSHGFETVIIDEAAQAVEVSTLIPLKYGCRRCILVGDPTQLPATVISKTAANYLYEQSLFQRLQAADHPVLMLNVQYRMHPLIREFPSKHFYYDRLIDGPNIDTSEGGQYCQLYHADPRFGPFLFFDVEGSESQRTSSFANVNEVKQCWKLFAQLSFLHPEIACNSSIGIITPYKQQRNHLRNFFQKKLDPPAFSKLDINTIDGFQGCEKDIVIFSCVRAHSGTNIGFLADVRRMNVALTRARFALWVVGHSPLLSQNSDWAALIEFAKRKNCYISPYQARRLFAHSTSHSSSYSSYGSYGSSDGGSLKRSGDSSSAQKRKTRTVPQLAARSRSEEVAPSSSYHKQEPPYKKPRSNSPSSSSTRSTSTFRSSIPPSSSSSSSFGMESQREHHGRAPTSTATQTRRNVPPHHTSSSCATSSMNTNQQQKPVRPPESDEAKLARWRQKNAGRMTGPTIVNKPSEIKLSSSSTLTNKRPALPNRRPSLAASSSSSSSLQTADRGRPMAMALPLPALVSPSSSSSASSSTFPLDNILEDMNREQNQQPQQQQRQQRPRRSLP